jgi:protein-L-isoaspartate(D-aspartate) O-methyltransferase
MVASLHLQRMVDEIDQRFSLEPYVKRAFLSVDREAFVTSVFKHLAYKLDALPMQADQWISSPLTVAKMTQHLELKGVDSVLEVGCGSGYQAAILSQIVRRVFTIERIDPLLREAKERFRTLELSNIFTRYDDGQRGWKEYAPYDRIIFSATADKIPEVLFEQLAEGGILIAPLNNNRQGQQIITRYEKRYGRISAGEPIESCLFVPVLSGTKK